MTQEQAYRRNRLDLFLMLLAIVWSGMKLCGLLPWPWWLVLSPLYVPALVYLMFWSVVLLWIVCTAKQR